MRNDIKEIKKGHCEQKQILTRNEWEHKKKPKKNKIEKEKEEKSLNKSKKRVELKKT